MVEAVRQQRNNKDNLSRAEIMALIQANLRTVIRPIQINLVEQGQKKGMECCDGRGQHSIDDVAESGGPKEKLAISSFLSFVFL